MDLNRFMLIYIRFNVLMCVFYVFMSLVWPTSVPQALFFRQKSCYLIWGLCEFWKLSQLSEL